MRTSRWILYTALGTVLCLLYVFQQTEIVKLGYRITSAEKNLSASLDRRTSLQYILSSLESPLSIDKNLFLNKDSFEMAGKYILVKVVSKANLSGIGVAAQKKESLFKRLALQTLFAGKQAEARTLK